MRTLPFSHTLGALSAACNRRRPAVHRSTSGVHAIPGARVAPRAFPRWLAAAELPRLLNYQSIHLGYRLSVPVLTPIEHLSPCRHRLRERTGMGFEPTGTLTALCGAAIKPDPSRMSFGPGHPWTNRSSSGAQIAWATSQ
ncbi:hypothetical protein PYCCODRAFT_1434522 [Trametes coccinea BRFM310]|uniref:Uncharacterized protein n=1 Tax=Trametes coccinea (strain BRFM310) TaxID=1353009 RepID=A0A1Y2IR48_TRAC3|nr:hypothetical protein PYCCODRAFT_1434522 [Trametes coccinea BRFM310]